MKILTIAASTLASVLLMIFVSFNFPTAYSEGVKNIKEATLKVEGMTCSMCPLTIKTALKKLDGVINADVSYNKREVIIQYDASKATVEDMIRAIENAGDYNATLVAKAG